MNREASASPAMGVGLPDWTACAVERHTMRRILLLATVSIATLGAPATTLADQRVGSYATPPAVRPQAPTPAASRTIYREPVFSVGPFGDGRRGFGLRGGFAPFGGFYGGLGGGTSTDVDVDVDVRGDRSSNAPVVIQAPRLNADRARIARLEEANRALRAVRPEDLRYLGIAATATGPGSKELRQLVGTIIAQRERERRERVSGARVVVVDELQRELGDERAALREIEARPRNKHILYLGFDD